MQVSFNPYITNQQQIKQPTHKAVIQKYVDVAKKDVKICGVVCFNTLRKIIIEAYSGSISSIDAIDTLKKIKEFSPTRINIIESYVDTLYTWNKN